MLSRLICCAVLCAFASAATGAPVGVKPFLVTDATRHDSLKPDLKREWMVDVYYPATARSGKPTRYFDDPALLKKLVDGKYYDQKPDVLQRWATRSGAALRDAEQAKGDSLPLIVVLPGMGVARANYALLASAFVQRGFVVAVIDLPYLGDQRLPDGRILRADDDPLAQSEKPEDYAPRIREFVRDVSMTLDRLPAEVKFDPHAITVTGHSSGGAVAVDVCNADARVSACVDWEGGLEPTDVWQHGSKKPTLVGASRAKGRPETPVDAQHPDMLEQMRAALGKQGNHSCWVMKITGGSHMSYSDSPEVMPDTLSRFGGELISPQRSFELYTGVTAAFARAYAPGGGGDAAFAVAVKANPEITRTEKCS
jgi:putative ABC transport system permease protein